jgi:hypothetical protein
LSLIEMLRCATAAAGSYDLSWDKLRPLLPDFAITRKRCMSKLEGIIRAPPLRALDVDTFPLRPICTNDEHEESSAHSSGDDSSVAASSAVEGCEFPELEWVLPVSASGKMGTVHSVKEASQMYWATECGKNIKVGAAHGCGLYEAAKHQAAWCRQCIARANNLDPILGSALRAFNK